MSCTVHIMPASAISRFSSSQRWYRAQTKRWAALQAAGWKFRHAGFMGCTVGIVMTKDGRSRTHRVSSSLSYRQIHTQILEACERHALETKTPKK